jgi:hypothetical protein
MLGRLEIVQKLQHVTVAGFHAVSLRDGRAEGYVLAWGGVKSAIYLLTALRPHLP